MMSRKSAVVKRIGWFCTIIWVMSITACDKKDDSPSGNDGEQFLTCKINGKMHQFNFHVNANDKPDDWNKIHFVVISGWEGEDMSKSPGFGINLLVPEGAKETTYSVAGTSALELDGDYYIQNWKDGKHVGTTTYMGGRTSGTNFTLTITSLTKWGVKGKFSGLLRNGDAFLKITDGEFSAPYN